MDVINQGSTYILGLSFKDENGNGVTPSAGKYRIDVEGGNAITGNNANAWVAISPSGNTYDLTITANENGFKANSSTDREERVVTVEFTYGANSSKQTDEYRYMIKVLENLLNTP
jgi:hypothetical protein